MQKILRPAICLTFFGLAACDEIAVADDPAALADLRGQKSCLAAVGQQTGAAGVAINTTRPVVELYRYVVNVPGGASWSCITDPSGKAIEIAEQRSG
ncbi:hypothetical protein DSM110093_01635 [Sulfitobacter sp. DSM 110093]|uniref:hypothetical protein n=1 Tax=Sulfitobacter sp. DSM 110093 TaxID=2883127 RepID=UPI001FAE42C9|nr:hypothetical protein [Sulfitobacter sp. DSM 110093]UOA31860.1 hypothetical protein DSM110093_01635 [Sulfitobacter sp. DSM 110093]